MAFNSIGRALGLSMTFAAVSLGCGHQIYKDGTEPTIRNLKTKAKVALAFDTFMITALTVVGTLLVAGVIIPTASNGLIPYLLGGSMIAIGLTSAIVDALIYRMREMPMKIVEF